MNVIGKKVFFLFVIIFHINNVSNDFTENDVINNLMRRIKYTRKIRLVTIYNKRPEHLSPNFVSFIRKIAMELPVLIINTTELLSAPNNDRLNGVKKCLHFRSQRKSLNVLFVESKEDENVIQLLMDHIKFLETFFLKTTRPQVIFFLLNFNASLNLREFFEYSWSLKFLDIIVIELIKNIRDKNINGEYKKNSTAFFHQYNPFNDAYYKESPREVRTKKLFLRKLKDLHGYTLNTGMTDEIPMVMIDRNYTGDDAWGMAQGLDVMITRTLTETLNFKANIKVIYTSDNPNIKRFNVSNQFLDKALRDEAIDFAVNFYGMVGTKPLEDFDFESSIFLYPYTSNLIVKQYGKPVLKISRNLIIVAFVIVMTIISYTFGRWFLRLNPKIWNCYSIIKIISNNPLPMHLETVYERIFYLSLSVVSSVFSVNLLEQLLEIYLWQDTFTELHTLQDVIDADIVPSITHESKRMISSYNHTALKKILRHSSTIEYDGMVVDCIESLINHKSVNGCEVDSIVGRLVSDSFSNKERGWIISFVKEPIVQTCWTAMLLTKTSPYHVQFNHMLRQFSEAGLITFWQHEMLRNFTFIYKNFFGEEELHHVNSDFHRNYVRLSINKTSLNKSLTFFLTMGHLISCLVFICECIIGHFWRART